MKIAFIGKMRSGKTTAARYLANTYGMYQVSFATPLKAICRLLYGQSAAGKNREMLQDVGTKIREYDPETFVRIAVHDARRHHNVVCDDCRMLNEYSSLRAEGFVFIRIEACENVRIARAQAAGDRFSIEDLRHPSETQMDGLSTDYTISNEGTRDELYRKLDDIISDLYED